MPESALCFVKAKSKIPPRSLVVGNPGKVIKELSDEMIDWKTKGTRLYQQLPADMREHWSETEPLREMPEDRPSQDVLYQTWEEIKEG